MNFFTELPTLSRFAIILALIIIFPRCAERIGLPGIVGLLIGGYLLGPNALGVIQHEGPVISFFSEMGVLLLMFFAGFEIDPERFKAARTRSLIFGILTAAIPLAGGVTIGIISGYSWISSVLIGSLLASHTLLALPIISASGLMARDSVIVTVGATVVTDITALLILAICIPLFQIGFSPKGLAIQLTELAIYIPVVVLGIGKLGQFMLRHFGKSDEGKLVVKIALIVTAAQLAHAINLEGIVGAFLTGLALRRAVGEPSIAHSLESVSQALFIPAFFLTTGGLIDPVASFHSLTQNPGLVIGVVGGLFVAKFLAAAIFSAIYRYSKTDRNLMWSLSLPQVAATLAAAQVAFNTRNSAGERLLDAPMFDTILVLVLLTSIMGPVLTRLFVKSDNSTR